MVSVFAGVTWGLASFSSFPVLSRVSWGLLPADSRPFPGASFGPVKLGGVGGEVFELLFPLGSVFSGSRGCLGFDLGLPLAMDLEIGI